MKLFILGIRPILYLRNKNSVFLLNKCVLFSTEGRLFGFRVRKRVILCTITSKFV